jgi:hypothetical protein
MNKYITDTFKNNLKSIISDCTKPQKKAITEVVRWLITEWTPILRHLAQNEEVSAKKQAERFSYHLCNVDLSDSIEKVAIRHANKQMGKYTIVSYDLSDISKESAMKMENIRRVFDGSKREVANGYTFHWIGINHMLIGAKIHNWDKDYLPQIRKKILIELFNKLDNKWVLVADRGNDDKQFFKFLRSELKINFIVRLKETRQVVLAKTGVKSKVKDLKEWQYYVYLMNKYNTKTDTNYGYRLIIRKHLANKEPIRLLTTLPKKRFSKKHIVTMYLERWGVESSFKRIKGKFNLERIRVLKYQTFLNLIALSLFTMLISTVIFQRIQKMNNQLIAGVLLWYKQFINKKSLSFNLDSFISYIQNTLPKITFRDHDPPDQMKLFKY